MPKESEPIEKIEQRRDRLSHIIDQRKDLLDQIGTGEIKLRSSWENTLKIGRVKGKVRDSITRMTNKFEQLDQEFKAYSKAREYLDRLSLRQAQLEEIKELVKKGDLPEDVLTDYQREYEAFASIPDNDIFLKRAVIRVRQEREEERKLVDKRQKEVREIPRVKSKKVTFELPNGQVVKGEIAELLTILTASSEDNLIGSDSLISTLFPGVEYDTARKRLRPLLSKMKKDLIGTGLELISTVKKGPKGEKSTGVYYTKRSTPENKKERAVEKSLLFLTLLGDTVRFGDKQIRLSKVQSAIFDCLGLSGENPVHAQKLLEEARRKEDIKLSGLPALIASLNQELAKITGLENIIVLVKDEIFGMRYKIEGAKVDVIFGFKPIGNSKLKILQSIFNNGSISKQQIIETLTEEGEKSLTEDKVLRILEAIVKRLERRVLDGIATDEEIIVYQDMGKHGSKRQIARYMAQRLGINIIF